MENQSELIFSEGLLSLRAASSDRDGVEREEEGVGLDPNLSLLWEYYFKWALERYQDEECTFKTVKKKVGVNATIGLGVLSAHYLTLTALGP